VTSTAKTARDGDEAHNPTEEGASPGDIPQPAGDKDLPDLEPTSHSSSDDSVEVSE
jgi:hypothetical protein